MFTFRRNGCSRSIRISVHDHRYTHKAVQKPEPVVRGILEKLVEAGMVEAHGTGKGRNYTLSAKVYRGAGQKAAYVRQAGFDTIQQKQMVLNFIDTHGSIKRADVVELCHLTPDQAYKLLAKLKKEGQIQQTGERKGLFIRGCVNLCTRRIYMRHICVDPYPSW